MCIGVVASELTASCAMQGRLLSRKAQSAAFYKTERTLSVSPSLTFCSCRCPLKSAFRCDYTHGLLSQNNISQLLFRSSTRISACFAMNLGLSQPRSSLQFKAAFEAFEKQITTQDARSFNNTKLEDVWAAARTIERQLAAQGLLRNMARIEPLLNRMKEYGKIVEVLCNGTPYLSWIWVSIDHVYVYISWFSRLIGHRRPSSCCCRYENLLYFFPKCNH